MKPSGTSKGYHTDRREHRPRSISLPLLVQSYSLLRLQRLHSLVVTFARQSRDSNVGPVVVRPVIAGALVSPAEAKLDPSHPGARAAFHVTPVVRGVLAPARLEVWQQGRLMGTVSLSMRTVTQWLTAMLAIFAVLFTGLCVFALTHPEYTTADEAGAPGPVEQNLLRYVPPVAWLTQPIAHGVQRTYDGIYRQTAERYLAFWSGLVLTLLATASWFGHQRRRQEVHKVLEWHAPAVAADPLDEPTEENPAIRVKPIE